MVEARGRVGRGRRQPAAGRCAHPGRCRGWKEITLCSDKRGSWSQEEGGWRTREEKNQSEISRLGSYLEEAGYLTCGH